MSGGSQTHKYHMDKLREHYMDDDSRHATYTIVGKGCNSFVTVETKTMQNIMHLDNLNLTPTTLDVVTESLKII